MSVPTLELRAGATRRSIAGDAAGGDAHVVIPHQEATGNQFPPHLS